MNREDLDREVKPGEKMNLGFALRELGSAVSSMRASDCLRDVQAGLRYLTEFINGLVPVPELSEEEANLSACLHTYMRKYMDGPLSTLLYVMISQGRGVSIWYVFVKALHEHKGHVGKAMRATEPSTSLFGTTDDNLLWAALRLWQENGMGEAVKEMWSLEKENSEEEDSRGINAR